MRVCSAWRAAAIALFDQSPLRNLWSPMLSLGKLELCDREADC